MTLQLPTRETTVFWYLATDLHLARGGSGNTDLGVPFRTVARSRSYAPAGIGGEAAFYTLHLSLFRQSDDDLQLRLIPVVDGVEVEPIDFTLEAAPDPVREIHEIGLVEYYPSAADPQVATVRRGTWFTAELRSQGTLPTGRVEIESAELEFEVVLEGRQSVNATP